MNAFVVRVIETITVEKSYVIEAPTRDEAKIKALSGDTISETTIRELDVINREIVD
jgi:hypothetical protein